jgi:hypothetical protein
MGFVQPRFIVLTARRALNPFMKQTRFFMKQTCFFFKGLNKRKCAGTEINKHMDLTLDGLLSCEIHTYSTAPRHVAKQLRILSVMSTTRETFDLSSYLLQHTSCLHRSKQLNHRKAIVYSDKYLCSR